MPLTDTACKNASLKADGSPAKYSDSAGMYLLVNKTGKYWRMNYRFASKYKTLALGVYPDTSLKEARDKRDEARRQLSEGTDPGESRKQAKITKRIQTENTFEAIAREWYDKQQHNWTASHSKKTLGRLEHDVFPYIGTRPIAEINAPELLSMLRIMETRGVLDTAHRVHQVCGQIFRYAIATGRTDRDPSGDLRGALPPIKQQHYASVRKPSQIAELLRAIDGYTGSHVTLHALQLAPLLFVRPGELRYAEWGEFDFEGAEWRIPAEKMKMRVLHIVPLSKQAIAILKELQPITERGKYLFPSVRTGNRPMSENTINAALRRLGYTTDEMTGHGFRSMASTLLNEQGWNRDAIERQLAHAERDNVRAAYNYAEFLPERRKMMQAWADYLEALKTGAQVIPFRNGTA